jgi:hypothetical protein
MIEVMDCIIKWWRLEIVLTDQLSNIPLKEKNHVDGRGRASF